MHVYYKHFIISPILVQYLYLISGLFFKIQIMMHLRNLFDKIIYITKICSSPAQTSKLVCDVIAVQRHTIYSFKLNREIAIMLERKLM